MYSSSTNPTLTLKRRRKIQHAHPLTTPHMHLRIRNILLRHTIPHHIPLQIIHHILPTLPISHEIQLSRTTHASHGTWVRIAAYGRHGAVVDVVVVFGVDEVRAGKWRRVGGVVGDVGEDFDASCAL